MKGNKVMADITEAEIWRQLIALAERRQQVATKATVCLYAWQDGLKVAGTGVLLAVADKHFLLSAAHVMDLTFIHGFQFHACLSRTEPLVGIEFVCRCSSIKPAGIDSRDSCLRDNDSIDLSAAEIAPKSIGHLARRHSFLNLADLDFMPPRKGDGILVFGYPERLTVPAAGEIDHETFPTCVCHHTSANHPRDS